MRNNSKYWPDKHVLHLPQSAGNFHGVCDFFSVIYWHKEDETRIIKFSFFPWHIEGLACYEIRISFGIR